MLGGDSIKEKCISFNLTEAAAGCLASGAAGEGAALQLAKQHNAMAVSEMHTKNNLRGFPGSDSPAVLI